MSIVSKLFERRDLRARLFEERAKRRRLEIAAVYRAAREEALLSVIEEFRLEEQAAEALIEATTDAYPDAERVRARHERERP